MNKMLGYLNGYKRESVLAPLFKMLEALLRPVCPAGYGRHHQCGHCQRATSIISWHAVRHCWCCWASSASPAALRPSTSAAKAAVGYATSPAPCAVRAYPDAWAFPRWIPLGTSTLITRMTSDLNQVQSGLNLFLRLFLRSPFVVFGGMIMAFTVNAQAALIFVVAIPLLSRGGLWHNAWSPRPLYKTRADPAGPGDWA